MKADIIVQGVSYILFDNFPDIIIDVVCQKNKNEKIARICMCLVLLYSLNFSLKIFTNTFSFPSHF